MKCVIVVPVYRPFKDKYEIESFSSACRVCRNDESVDLSIVSYEGVDLSSFKNLADKYSVEVNVIFFSRKFFRDIHGYNKLMLDIDFYRSFFSYDYMLICQLDAILFKDNLMEWCEKGYDYIGAPIFSPAYKGTFDYSVVGNGGLSLRNISKFVSVLKSRLSIKEILHIDWPNHPKYTFVRRILYRIMLFFMGRFPRLFVFCTHWVPEDLFFSFVVSCSSSPLSVPTVKEAACFSFDLNHSFLYRVLSPTIPFGVHRWNARNAECSRPYIESSGLSGESL